MRIAWFTPASGESGVVQYSRRVLEALRRIADPVLFCDGPAEGFPEDLEWIDFGAHPGELAGLDRYDAVFYNLGNNVQYHGLIWEVSRAHPGIMVLHDRVLHHLFVAHLTERAGGADAYRERMRALYGPGGADLADRWLDPSRRGEVDRGALLNYSFSEEAVRGARGLVVHSRWHADALRAFWKGPLCELWLPAHGPPASPRRRRSSERVSLLTLGHVEFNKHADKIVRLFAQDRELAARAQYLIAGPYHSDSIYVRGLSEEIAASSLAGVVELLGYLAPEELDRQAEAADIFVNLRRPNFEGCSASLMFQLPFGKPTIVYRSGSFAELPDDVVIKVKPGDGADLHRRILELVRSDRRRAAVGRAAREFVERHSPSNYAQQLVAFAADVGSVSPQLMVADRVGRELAALGADPRLAGVRRVTREMVSLLGPGGGDSQRCG